MHGHLGASNTALYGGGGGGGIISTSGGADEGARGGADYGGIGGPYVSREDREWYFKGEDGKGPGGGGGGGGCVGTSGNCTCYSGGRGADGVIVIRFTRRS